jgi:hypothetical protein
MELGAFSFGLVERAVVKRKYVRLEPLEDCLDQRLSCWDEIWVLFAERSKWNEWSECRGRSRAVAAYAGSKSDGVGTPYNEIGDKGLAFGTMIRLAEVTINLVDDYPRRGGETSVCIIWRVGLGCLIFCLIRYGERF